MTEQEAAELRRYAAESETRFGELHAEMKRLAISTLNATRRKRDDDIQRLAERSEQVIKDTYAAIHGLRKLINEARWLARKDKNVNGHT